VICCSFCIHFVPVFVKKTFAFLTRRRTLKGSSGQTRLETQIRVKKPSFFFIKIPIINKILAVRSEGLFWAKNKVRCSFGFGLWAWPFEASHYARLKATSLIDYFQPISLYSTKFGHSISQPLNFNGHSVKRPLARSRGIFYVESSERQLREHIMVFSMERMQLN
jgi:hypothetical protein